MVPRWWGTSERRSRRLEGKLGSLLKGEQSFFFSPHRLWPETARPESSPLVQVFSRLGKERDGDSLSSSTSFFLLESISHSAHILDKPYGWMLRVTLVHPKWQIIVAHPLRVPPVSLWVGGFISSQTPGFLGWGSSWRWWGSWRVWPHRPVVAGYLKCRSRRTERPGALMRLRRRCHGDCWPCCRLGCRLGWWDRWLWTPLAWDLTEQRGKREKKDSKNVLTKAEHAFVQIHI